MKRYAASAAVVTFSLNGSPAIQNASPLPKPPGTRLTRPIT